MSTSTVPLTPPDATGGKTRLDFIDGLRGVAILLVLLRHYYLVSYAPTLPRALDILGLGYVGVHLFLLLSGFCVSWAYVGDRHRAFHVGDFFVRRAQRILPAYYVTLAVSLVIAAIHQQKGLLWQAATHLTMTHNLFRSTVLELNGPFWSLALECQLYLFFPLWLALSRRRGPILMLLTALVLEIAFRVGVAQRFGVEYNSWTFVLPWGVAGRVLEFALGVFAAILLGKEQKPKFLLIVQKFLPATSLLLFAAAYAFKHKFGTTAVATDIAWSMGFLCLLLAAGAIGGLVNRICSWKPLTAVGVISYSTYLVHDLMLGHIVHLLQGSHVTTAKFALLLPVSLSGILIISYGFYLAVEKPSIAYFAAKRKKHAMA